MSENEPTKELFITTHPNEVHIALLEDKKLVEIRREKTTEHCSVGDIYLAKVRKLIPGLNAAFVDIGLDKEGFLHYLDLGLHGNTINAFVQQAKEKNKKSIVNFPYEPTLPKAGKIGDVLTQGQEILVQVAKEPMSSKGARVTAEISFAGRYLVLIPFSDSVSISQKIKNPEEKKRLKKLVQSIKPKKFGVIIRTVAEGKKVEDITADMEQVTERWKLLVSKLNKAKAPTQISADIDKTSAIIRDMLHESFSNIYVDSPKIYDELKAYLKSISFQNIQILHLYKESQPLFEKFFIAKQIKGSFGKLVVVKNGIYLIVEHTEAMHVIDVNSGKKIARKTDSQEDSAMEANMIAAEEIARQIRLRDMGGIISIDFIDLDKKSNQKKLYTTFSDYMRNDKSRHTILPLNQFGIMQVTRHRVRKETNIDTSEMCPACQGSGKIKPSIMIVDEIENTIDFLINKQLEKNISLVVHPFLYSYLTQNFKTYRLKWFVKYKQWIKISPNENFYLTQYQFYNKAKEEIMLWGEMPI